jgi:hypothetical protein
VTRVNQITKGKIFASRVISKITVSLSFTLSVKKCMFEESILDPAVVKWWKNRDGHMTRCCTIGGTRLEA